MFQILCALITAASFLYFTNFTLVIKVAFFLGTLAVGWLADFYIVKKVPFFKLLSTGILVALNTFILGILAWTLEINLKPYGNSSWIEAFFLSFILIALYISIRVGGNATYFRKKIPLQDNDQADKYLIDTCVIIDGRILDIASSGFIPRLLCIPQFVIQELQLISDSHNHEKRTKGRRGLELLKQMKNSDHLSVRIITDDVPEEKNVDRKLLALAKKDHYKIITTDYNLVKVAQLQNLKTLNINHLATLIKASLNVGERLRIFITKKGNNRNQGIAFLPDDTMIVIEEAERYIGQQKSVLITSYIQNESGRIAFARLAD
ncbi:hypothetical protein COTS27_01437 [Spirochaetota bacterium]|nr:hypothetical protein COTS27_01437 [Spirochaetota bacterium]